MPVADAITLLAFALGAFIVPLGARKVGIPAAVGELLYGIAIGPHALGLVSESSFTAFLAELGFAFLMFLVGLELDFAHISRERPWQLALQAIAAAAVFAIAYAFTFVLRLPVLFSVVFGAMSVGILLAALTELRLTRTPFGRSVVLVGSVGEALTILLLTGLHVFYEFGFGPPFWIELGELGLILAVAYLLLLILRTMIWWRPQSFARVVQGDDPTEVGVRAGMALMLSFVALAALLDLEAIVGAFIAGALFSFVFRHKGTLEAKLSSIGFGFFVPIFFIHVGTRFDLAAVGGVGTWKAVGIYLVASLCSKMLPAMLLLLRGMTVREAVGAGLLLGAPLTLLVAIARIGTDARVFDSSTASAIILLAVITSIVFPYAFRLVVKPRVSAAEKVTSTTGRHPTSRGLTRVRSQVSNTGELARRPTREHPTVPPTSTKRK